MIEQNCNTCGGCNGCGLCCGSGELILSPLEYKILIMFAELPFIPAGFAEDSDIPFCKDFEGVDSEYSAALLCLQQKMLISIDPDIPLVGFDYSEYSAYPFHGSMALTGYGQRVLEQLEYQGVEGD